MANKINIKNTFVYSALAVCLITLFVVAAHIILFSNKGFELSDETYYLYFSWNFNSEVYTVTNFGLLNKLFCFNHPTLVNLRLARFFYQSFAVIVFIYSLLKFLNHKQYIHTRTQSLFVLITALMASYINYDYLPMTLSYNTWSLILMLLCFSVIFMEYTSERISDALITSSIYGFLCFSFFLIKFPNAFIAGFIYLVFNIISIRRNTGYKLIGLVLGALLAYFVFLNNFQDLKNILHNYYLTIFEVKHVQANSYFDQLSVFFQMCLEKQFLTVELAVILTSVIIKKYLTTYISFAAFALLVFNYVLASSFFGGNSISLYNDFLAATVFIINALLFIYMFSENTKGLLPPKEISLLIGFLLVTPLGLMIGTDNLFYYTTSQTMVFALSAVLVYVVYSKQFSTYFLALNCMVICLFLVSALFHGMVKTPYRQNNLLEKKYPLHFTKPLEGIYESYERFVDYTAMNSLITRFNDSKKPVVTFFTHIGIQYLNGCEVFPEAPISDGRNTIWYNEYILTRSNFNDRFDLIVAPVNVENNKDFKVMLAKYGVKLDENYKLVYVYKFLSTNENVYLYKKQIQ